jgi:hypothetical protein
VELSASMHDVCRLTREDGVTGFGRVDAVPEQERIGIVTAERRWMLSAIETSAA